MDFPALTLLGSKSNAATLLTMSRSVMRPIAFPVLSTTTTHPISCFLMSLVAVRTESVSLMVVTGLDITSSTLTSGVPSGPTFVFSFESFLGFKDFAGGYVWGSGAVGKVLSIDSGYVARI